MAEITIYRGDYGIDDDEVNRLEDAANERYEQGGVTEDEAVLIAYVTTFEWHMTSALERGG